MRSLAAAVMVGALVACGSASGIRVVSSLPPSTCKLLAQTVTDPVAGSEALRPPFSGTLLTHLLGFFTIDADWDTIVFMDARAAAEDVDAVQSRLTNDPRVAALAYLDHDAAFTEFKALFADQPQIGNSLTPAETPTSFKVKLSDRTKAQAMFDDYGRVRGVYQVIAPSDAVISARAAQFHDVIPLLDTLLHDGATPSLLHLTQADQRLAPLISQHSSLRIVGAGGVFSDDDATLAC